MVTSTMSFRVFVVINTFSLVVSGATPQFHGVKPALKLSPPLAKQRQLGSFVCCPRVQWQSRTRLPFSAESRPLMKTQKSDRFQRPERKMVLNAFLPPDGKGGGGDQNQFENALTTVLTIAGVTLFFLSPLGGLFFAVFNSLFLLALITPLILVGGFQIWAKFNTVQSQCPSCGAPVVLPKNDPSGGMNVCLGCGSFVRLTQDGKDVELCNPGPNFEGQENVDQSWADSLFGAGVGGATTGSKASAEEQKKKSEREQTIIDVEVKDV